MRITDEEARAIGVALPHLEAGCWHYGLRDDSDPDKRAVEATLALLRRLKAFLDDIVE